MLTSLGLLFLSGMFLGWIFRRINLPPLIGMIIAGIITGPGLLGLLSGTILDISADLRKTALIIILTRAGLSLDLNSLKKVGRPAIMMCFVPACFEMLGCVIIAPVIFGITRIEAAVIGSVIAAVSPAVVVPRMLRLMDEKYGTQKGIPQMIMAAASVDDVFVIVFFTAFTSLANGESVSLLSFALIPVSIVLGILLGIVSGFVMSRFFETSGISVTSRVIVMLSVSFMLTALENALAGIIPVASLISIMAMGAAILRLSPDTAKDLSSRFAQLWIAAEILLFTLVGAAVDIRYAAASFAGAIAVIAFSMVFRMAGVQICLFKTILNKKERIFSAFSYMPKATVQAAIGAVPLAMGLSCGDTVLTVAVWAIFITAPTGALLMDTSYRKLLEKEV
ncbi:cation:proton antiporter [Lachnospiraceae bacterium NSJ-143]|nr:cation:proton antiporter [Lachnospiraceae bacterium NSJ-143]